MKVLVTGAGGQVGRELVDALAPHEVIACTHADLDAGDRDAALAAITSAAARRDRALRGVDQRRRLRVRPRPRVPRQRARRTAT